MTVPPESVCLMASFHGNKAENGAFTVIPTEERVLQVTLATASVQSSSWS